MGAALAGDRSAPQGVDGSYDGETKTEQRIDLKEGFVDPPNVEHWRCVRSFAGRIGSVGRTPRADDGVLPNDQQGRDGESHPVKHTERKLGEEDRERCQYQ